MSNESNNNIDGKNDNNNNTSASDDNFMVLDYNKHEKSSRTCGGVIREEMN